MSRLDLFRLFLLPVLLLLLVWDVFLWLMEPAHQLPPIPRELLLTGPEKMVPSEYKTYAGK